MDTSRLVTHIEDINWEENKRINEKDEGTFKILVSKSRTDSSDLMLGIGRLAPREVHVMHHHPDSSEFYFVMSGSGKIIIENRMVEARPGLATYIPHNYRHKIINDSNGTLVIMFGHNVVEYQTIWDE
jgi:mannose-6-phosphate isomerase-like protein (cupin superfamily)